MQKVYLSSTFRDLKDYREEVISFFNRFREDFLLLAMEDYVAQDHPPLDVCENHARTCDLYILVIGNRYGFIPEEERNKANRYSITRLEYEAAVNSGKRILVFVADIGGGCFIADDDADEKLRDEKKSKLDKFKKEVLTNKLTHPENFISPFQLTLQIAESLMKTGLLKWQIDSYRQFCLDRGAQFGAYISAFSLSKFKVFIISGNEADLPGNLVNRFAMATLNLRGSDIVFLNCQDFIVNDNYAGNRELLLSHLFEEVVKNRNVADKTCESFIETINNNGLQPPVVRIEISKECLTRYRTEFLANFFNELYNASKSKGLKQRLYIFLSIVDENAWSADTAAASSEFTEITGNCIEHFSILPRLSKAGDSDIKQWLHRYITVDDGIKIQIIQNYFKDLPRDADMLIAEKKLKQLIRLINTGDTDILNLLNN